METPKLTVGVVSLHSCIRAHKLGLPLADKGIRSIFFAENLYEGAHYWFAHHAAVKLYRHRDGRYDRRQFKEGIEALDSLIDVYHVHNEPDWMIPVIREVTDTPIVYDIHDMVSVRKGSPDELEDKCVEQADGISVVSRKYQENIIKRVQTKPVREILSCLPRGWMPEERAKVFRGGLVYEGGLGGPNIQEFPCRDWSKVFSDIRDLGIQVWAYRGNPSALGKHYPHTVLLGPLNYHLMVRELTMYEFGLIGSPVPDPMFDGALPNKLFEYMAAGLPMINMNAPDVEDFLAATGMGVTVRDVKDIPDAMQHMRDHRFRRRVWQNRVNWTAETQIPKVEWLYERVTGKKLQKPLVPGEYKKKDIRQYTFQEAEEASGLPVGFPDE